MDERGRAVRENALALIPLKPDASSIAGQVEYREGTRDGFPLVVIVLGSEVDYGRIKKLVCYLL